MQPFEVMCTCRWCFHVYAVYPSNLWLYAIGFILTGVQGLADTIGSRSHGGQDLQSDSQSRRTTFAQLARKIVQFALCHLVCFLQRGISKIIVKTIVKGRAHSLEFNNKRMIFTCTKLGNLTHVLFRVTAELSINYTDGSRKYTVNTTRYLRSGYTLPT